MTTTVLKRQTVALGACAILCFLAISTARAERPEPEVYGVFDGDEMFTLLPPDGIPAILDPEYLAGEAAAAQMSPTEHVLGLASANDAVCWSTWQLDHHEIVNDVFEGRPIAATW